MHCSNCEIVNKLKLYQPSLSGPKIFQTPDAKKMTLNVFNNVFIDFLRKFECDFGNLLAGKLVSSQKKIRFENFTTF